MSKDTGLSLDREDLDAQLQAAADKQKKKKRKKIIRRIIIAAIILALVFIIGIGIIIAVVSSKAKGQTVTVVHAKEGELIQEVKVTGSVQSDNVQHYYAPASIKVDKVAELGSFVKKGDPIVIFDKESYEVALKQLELRDKIEENSYQSTVTQANNTQNKYWQAKNDINKYQAIVDEKQAIVDKFNDEESDVYKFLNINGPTQLQLEATKQSMLGDKISAILAAKEMQGGILTDEQQAELDVVQAAFAESQNISKNIQKQMEMSKNEFADASAALSENKVKLETAKSQAESYSNLIGNQYDQENRDLNGELNTLKSGSDYEELAKYTNGCLLAPFDGIVTGVYVSEGMTTSITGGEMVAFSSIDEVSIGFSLSKKDLTKVKEGQEAVITILDNEYKGKVTQISRMASIGSSGSSSVSAVIKVENPDDNIFLGVEGKAVITTATVNNCIKIASEAINIDSDGYYVYIVNDLNIVEKRAVEVGITTDGDIEVISGITTDDKVVSYVSSSVFEGAVVVPIDQDEINAAINGALSEYMSISVEADKAE